MNPAPKYPELKDAYALLDGLQRKRAQPQAPMMLICAWCKKLLRDGAQPASHGICDSCSDETFGSHVVGVIARSSQQQDPPRSPLHDGYGVQRRAWPAWSILVWSILFFAGALSAQVTAVAELHSGVAELRIGNPTTAPLSVELTLWRDATKEGQPVALGDSVLALISPASFTLRPGEVQTVRIRVRDTVRTGELLRLATLFTPLDAESPEQGMKLLVRTRLITKVVAVTP